MNKENIKNWKLVEVLDKIEIVRGDSGKYFDILSKELNIPTTNHSSFNREFTHIDWEKMPTYSKFYIDDTQEDNELSFNKSQLSKKDNMLILYGSKEPAVLVPTRLFIKDWEDFLESLHWETIMFSEDFELVMEVSRDYYFHSNFKIR